MWFLWLSAMLLSDLMHTKRRHLLLLNLGERLLKGLLYLVLNGLVYHWLVMSLFISWNVSVLAILTGALAGGDELSLRSLWLSFLRLLS